jgi:flagellar biosynthesis protein FliP
LSGDQILLLLLLLLPEGTCWPEQPPLEVPSSKACHTQAHLQHVQHSNNLHHQQLLLLLEVLLLALLLLPLLLLLLTVAVVVVTCLVLGRQQSSTRPVQQHQTCRHCITASTKASVGEKGLRLVPCPCF